MTTIIKGKQELLGRVGDELGVSEWHEITQDQVNKFADATGDHQWIHVDPEKAALGPFGTTIAHGYLTLALGPKLSWETVTVEGVQMGINYGSDRVRFITPVKVGARIRMRIKLADLKEVEPNGLQATFENTFEIEGEDKPACVAQVISRYYF
ncbi:MAG TPA: MaoC family dehydratase [Actinomycetota bacterium]|nr:MaoC family dehydratase [Actinomycetota bacterium]